MKIQSQLLHAIVSGENPTQIPAPAITVAIDELVGVTGLPLMFLNKAIRHLEPFLKTRNLSPVFWNTALNKPLEGETEIEPLSEEERQKYFFAFNSDDTDVADEVKPQNSLQDDLRLYFLGRYSGFDYTEAKGIMTMLMYMHGEIAFESTEGLSEDEIEAAEEQQEFENNVALLETLSDMYGDTPVSENPRWLHVLLGTAMGYDVMPDEMDEIEIDGTGGAEQDVLIKMIDTICSYAADRELPEIDPVLNEAILSYRQRQEQRAQVENMIGDFMSPSEPGARIISMGFGHVNPDGSHTSVEIDPATGARTESVDVADPSDTSIVMGDGSSAKH